MDAHPEFAAKLDRLDHDIGDRLESKALKEALGGDNQLLYKLLRARRPRYAEKVDREQLEHARAEARAAVLAELDAEIAGLPKAAREIVFAALNRSKKELTP